MIRFQGIIVCLVIIAETYAIRYTFPSDFKFGAITAAFGIEGGWREGLKGWSNFDFYTHKYPEIFCQDGNYNITELTEVAADSYHKYQEDVDIAKKIGIDFYRFSISWPRIFPQAKTHIVNQDGIDYYNRVIDAIIEAGIVPVITLFHYDQPAFGEPYFGGFSNDLSISAFVDYADFVFRVFGDRVKYWMTFNAPYYFCTTIQGDFLGSHFPDTPTGFYEYVCAHNILKAHAKTYRLYERKYKKQQKGSISITLPVYWFEPKSDCEEDKEAALRAHTFQFGWFVHPLVYGNYPKIMIDNIAKISKKQNLTRSRLPEFTKEEIEEIKGTFDYMALVPYRTYYVSAKCGVSKTPSVNNDVQVKISVDPSWVDPNKLFTNTPWGFRKAIKYVYENYKKPTISLTTQAYGALNDSLEDDFRVNFMKVYLQQVLELIHEDKVDIRSYSVFSLIDLIYFNYGLNVTSGLAQVDFKDPNRPRKLKASGKYYGDVIRCRNL